MTPSAVLVPREIDMIGCLLKNLPIRYQITGIIGGNKGCEPLPFAGVGKKSLHEQGMTWARDMKKL
jgi:hypothetical protein